MTILAHVTAGSSQTISIYPTNATSDYWTWSGYFVSWSADGPVDGFWTIDFEGIIDGALSYVGFA
jgi:hypothetical protein